METDDVKSNAYINSGKEINYKDSKFQIGDNVRTSKFLEKAMSEIV